MRSAETNTPSIGARDHFFRGNEHYAAGRFESALAEYEAAIAVNPELAEAYVNAGLLHDRVECLDQAKDCFNRAIEISPNLAEAHRYLAAVHLKMGHFEAAKAAVTRATELQPDNPETLLTLGNVHRMRNELFEAEAACRRALDIRPAFLGAWVNLANIYRAENRIPEALAACERALAIAPESPQAHLNAAMSLLVSGDLPAGWPHAEYRHLMGLGGAGRVFPQPLWTGEPLPQKTILLHGEQGFGDSLQFLRFVPLVEEKVGKVCIEIQTPLKELVAASFPHLHVLHHGETLPEFDVHCSLATLPFVFSTSLETIPSRVPYIQVPQAKVDRWRGFFGEDRRLRVGLAWAGNPTHPNDNNRSIPLRDLLPLFAAVPDVRFFSLKKEMSPADAATLEATPRLTPLAPQLGNFADTAALIEQIDLTIAVDTSVAHLAGALGRPVWVMLPFSPDWRWLLDRDDSPWYPTARLFRQPTTADWSTAIAQVAKALQGWASARAVLK